MVEDVVESHSIENSNEFELTLPQVFLENDEVDFLPENTKKSENNISKHAKDIAEFYDFLSEKDNDVLIKNGKQRSSKSIQLTNNHHIKTLNDMRF